MRPSLIPTKLGIPPVRAALVPRRRLIEQLNDGINAKISLISAPAGYGKTTLAAEWLQEAPSPATWLSLDEADNDPARFLSYFLAALQIIDEKAGKETQSQLQSPEPLSQDALMTILLNELFAVPSPFVLALDDYQVIETLSIHKWINFIVEHQPSQMHLVLLTREDPPLPLPRLRARGQINEIRQDDLRFTQQECADFLENVMGLKISKNEHAALEQRTEGWIAGLQLAAIAMQSTISAQGQEDLPRFVQEFTGSNRYVLDYLAQEVFESQPEKTQDFLLKTSILNRLCGSLCDAVIERPGSQSVIEMLEHDNLFIMPLDQSRNWYRYHRLFRDLLQKRLSAQDESAKKVLHSRASSWYEKHKLLPEAIQQALAGADWERALKLIHETNAEMSKRGEVFTLLNWYSQIPDHLILSDAETSLNYSWTLMLSSQFERAGFYLSQAEEHAGDDPSFRGQIFIAQSYMARAQGDHQRMVELSQQALSLLPKGDLDGRCMVSINLGIAYWHSGKMAAADHALAELLESGEATGNTYAVSTALLFQGMVMAVRGRLRDANSRFQTIILQDETPPFLRGLAYLYLSVLHYEWNHLEQSGKYLLEAIKIGERIMNDELTEVCWMMMARIYTADRNLAAAGKTLHKAFQRAMEGEVSAPVVPRLAAAHLQHAIDCGDLEAASVWATRLADGFDWHTFHRFTNITQARYLLAQNKTREAQIYLERCFERASQEGWVYGMIAIRSLQALAAPDTEKACEYLRDALVWAQPEGYLRTFVDVGGGIEPLLQAAIRRRILPEYVARIQSAVRDPAQKATIGQMLMVERLNPRELEVLRLLSAGYTNQQIASDLIISIGTAKTHVHNICGKLDAGNRREAVVRARELGLI